MFPLRAVHKPKRAPWITRLLIAVNVLVFVAQLMPGVWGDSWRHWALQMAVQPNCYLAPAGCGIELPRESELMWKPLFTSLFLHADWLHLGFNMLFLAVFGAGVEDKLGKLNFLAFYLVCGIGASLFFVATHPFSHVALIGASGAISGVLGAYLVLQTRSWILTYLPPVFLFPVPAPLFLIVWILMQFASQFSASWNALSWNRVLDVPGASQNNVAWIAHIAGFFIGAFWGWKIKPWWKRQVKSQK